MPTIPAFIDTNILLYAASTNRSEADKRDAARKTLAANPICFSVQVAQEFFVNATRKLTPPLSRTDALTFLSQIGPITVVPLDYELFQEATRLSERFQISYWDAAVVAAAKRMHCTTLYSEDLSAGQNYEGVTVANPFGAVTKT